MYGRTVPTAALRHADRALDALETLAGAGLSAQRLLEEATRRIDQVVPCDGYFLAATDPQTTLSLGAGVVRDLPIELCAPTWDYEFLVPDVLKFADIARSGRTVADLHDATAGRPERSARWREYAAASGFRAELRTTFNAGGLTWGIGQFDRLGDASRFSDEEKDWLERVTPIVARGLRQALLAQPASTAAERGPGLVLLDATGTLVSATAEAAAWLDEVEPTCVVATDGGVPMPFEAHAYAAMLRAAARDGDCPPPPRTRLRTRTGVWLLVHGSIMPGTEQLALIIEPAKASEVAPLIDRKSVV